MYEKYDKFSYLFYPHHMELEPTMLLPAPSLDALQKNSQFRQQQTHGALSHKRPDHEDKTVFP